MLLLLAFGVGMLGFGCFMVLRPLQFSRGIVQFSEKKWFHSVEITSRFIVGALFLIFSGKSSYPTTVTFIGGLLVFVSVLLIVIGPSRHKQFALLSSNIGENFKILGLFAILCGAGVVYLGST